MRSIKTLVSMAVAVTLAGAIAACGDDGGTGAGGTGGGNTTSSTSSTTSTGTGPAAPSFIAKTDPTKGELPEGIFVVGDKAYMGYAGLGKIVTVDLKTNAVSDFGSIPAPPMNGGFMLGIVVDAAGAVYVGFGGGPGDVVKNGVYKIPAAGGAVTDPWATNAGMNFPNGLVFDDKNNLFVSDSGGIVFKIAPDGTVTKWIEDPNLSAVGASCMFGAPFPNGANGIVLRNNVLTIANTNLAMIVTVPINTDGTAGKPTILAGPDCNALGGIDGIAADTNGDLYGVVNSQSKLVRLASGATKIEELFAGMPLDNPASIAIATVGGKKSAYITNASFFNMTNPAPGLLSYPLP